MKLGIHLRYSEELLILYSKDSRLRNSVCFQMGLFCYTTLPVSIWRQCDRICCCSSVRRSSTIRSYSCHLSPCDFHISGSLEKVFNVRWFLENVEVRDPINLLVPQKARTFFAHGIHILVTLWDTNLDRQIDHDQRFVTHVSIFVSICSHIPTNKPFQ